MSAASSNKLEAFFEKALASGEKLWDEIQASMQLMTGAEVETLADQAAELYSGASGDPIRHLLAEVTADEYGRRFKEPEQPTACNVVAFPKARSNPDAAGKIAGMAMEAAMVATGFMAEAEELANAFIADVDTKLMALDLDALEIVAQISADALAGEVCTLDQVILDDVIDAEVARRKALGDVLGGGEIWPNGDGAA